MSQTHKYHKPDKEQLKNYNNHFNKLIQNSDNSDMWTTINKAMEQAAKHALTKIEKPKNTNEDKIGLALLHKRKQALTMGDFDTYQLLIKAYTKHENKVKKKRLQAQIDDELDITTKWRGVKQLKNKYSPTPYTRRDKNNRHITKTEAASKAAKHLETQQWGNPHSLPQTNWNNERQDKIITQDLNYRLHPITQKEILRIRKLLPNNKAPGPNNQPAEHIKYLHPENIEPITKLFNQWFNGAPICIDALKANVAQIYKNKGSTSNHDNYRPISLLNSLLKLYATLLRERLSEQLDPCLQDTQYGFRKKRSTTQPLYILRKAAAYLEKTGLKACIVFLDWAKAFDTIDQQSIKYSLERLNVPKNLISAIMALFDQPTFAVTIEGHTSPWLPQCTGIRQGCPLSPYLFITIMSVLFYDIRTNISLNLPLYRMPGTGYDAVLYADDTALISENTAAMNRLIANVESSGKKYGLLLNKDECEILKTFTDYGSVPNVHFADGTPLKIVEQAKYLRGNNTL